MHECEISKISASENCRGTERRGRGVRVYGLFPFHRLYVTAKYKPPVYSMCMQTRNVMWIHAVHCGEFSLTVTTNSGFILQSIKVVSVVSDCAVLCVRSQAQNISRHCFSKLSSFWQTSENVHCNLVLHRVVMYNR